MKQNKILWIAMIVILIVMSSQAFALGIRPAKNTVDFKQGLTNSYSFTVVNDDSQPTSVKIYLEGDLKKYVRLHKTEATISANGELEIPYSVEFPSDAELPPGENLVKIIVEHSKQVDQSGISMAAKLKLAFKLTIRAPYPSKFVEAAFSMSADEQNIKMQTIVDNKGIEDIASVKPTYHIKEGTVDVFTATGDAKSLPKGQKGVFESFVKKTALPIGLYQALAIVNYDEKIVELSQDFKLGEEKISLLNYDKFIKFNDINPFNIDLKNEWNKIIQNVYAELKVFVGENVIDLRTESFSIMPRETKKITTYLDVRNIDAGAYDSELAVYYANKTEKTKFKLEILQPEDYSAKLAAAAVAELPAEIAAGGKGILSSNGVIIALIVANIIIIGAIAYLIYRKPPKIVSKISETFVSAKQSRDKETSQENASTRAVAELDSYIKRSLAQRMPKRELKQKLIAAGWPKWFVSEKIDSL
jgi:hypothetical protein